MKILYVTTIGATMGFFTDFIKNLINDGHTVDIATNTTISEVSEVYTELGCKIYNISCTRSPLNKNTLKAIDEIKKIVNENGYDIVHCHTPIAAMCTRLACIKARKNYTKVFYTAHGFHFYKGAPLKNWLIFYPIEKICSYFTDVLITINKEDYTLAKRKFKAKQIEYVPGVGVDTEKFANTSVDIAKKREELGVPQDAFLLLSVGELNTNKNHQVVIRAMADLENKNTHYMIAGQGNQHDNLINLAEKLGLSDRVHLLGRRQDVAELYKISDLFIHPSFREGLPVAIMEAMSAGLPCIASKIRGSADLICENSCLVNDPSCNIDFSSTINLYLCDHSLMEKVSIKNVDKSKKYDKNNIHKLMYEIYTKHNME